MLVSGRVRLEHILDLPPLPKMPVARMITVLVCISRESRAKPTFLANFLVNRLSLNRIWDNRGHYYELPTQTSCTSIGEIPQN